MREKLKTLSDIQLIELATELRKTTIPTDALIRTLIPEGCLIFFYIIEINDHLTQELADRLASKI